MIWLPGFLSQGGKKGYRWKRYSFAYDEKAGTAATVYRAYNNSKYASTAYTIRNGVFELTSPVATTFDNLTTGKRTVDIADSTNTVSSGATLYKITSNSGREYIQSEGSASSKTLDTTEDATFGLITSITFNSKTGKYTGTRSNTAATVADIKTGDIFYTGSSSFGSNSNITGATALFKDTVTDISYKTGTAVTISYSRTLLSSSVSPNVTIGYTPYTATPTVGDLIDIISDDDLTAYPLNGAQDGYWYEIVADGVNKIPYILSTGTQYLDTEYAPGSKTRMILDFAVSSEHTSGEGHIASVRDTGNSLFYTNYINPSQTNWYNGRRGSSAITKFTAIPNGYRRMLWDSNCNVLSVDGSEVHTFTEGDFRLSGSLTIFGRRNINGTTVTVDGFVKMCLWSGILLEDGVPVRGYIPCKDPNGVVCTYDVVNNEYIYNAGSGDFIAGE